MRRGVVRGDMSVGLMNGERCCGYECTNSLKITLKYANI